MFWAASEDGTVKQFDTRVKHVCESRAECGNTLISLKSKKGTIELYRYGVRYFGGMFILCSIAMNQRNSNYIAVAGGDPIVRLYDRR